MTVLGPRQLHARGRSEGHGDDEAYNGGPSLATEGRCTDAENRLDHRADVAESRLLHKQRDRDAIKPATRRDRRTLDRRDDQRTSLVLAEPVPVRRPIDRDGGAGAA